MPRSRPNISICGQEESECVKNVNKELKYQRNSSFKCDACLSGCFALTYSTSFSMSKIFEQNPWLKEKNLNPKNIAILHAYYAQTSFRSEKKEELFGFADFLCKDPFLFCI